MLIKRKFRNLNNKWNLTILAETLWEVPLDHLTTKYYFSITLILPLTKRTSLLITLTSRKFLIWEWTMSLSSTEWMKFLTTKRSFIFPRMLNSSKECLKQTKQLKRPKEEWGTLSAQVNFSTHLVLVNKIMKKTETYLTLLCQKMPRKITQINSINMNNIIS